MCSCIWCQFHTGVPYIREEALYDAFKRSKLDLYDPEIATANVMDEDK
jgi:hypothetical protein